MIEINEIFTDSDKRLALWCDSVIDTNDLAGMADYVIQNDMHLISVPPELVYSIWTYLEHSNVDILTRFVLSPESDIDSCIYDLAQKITSVCKKGAKGVQIFMKMRDFEKFAEKISVVRDDLFFGHDLCVGIDAQDLDMQQLPMVFEKLCNMRVNAFALTLNEDKKNRSDFVGRIYGILQNWNLECELHFILGNNFDRMDQAIRLVESEKPELLSRLRFFLDY